MNAEQLKLLGKLLLKRRVAALGTLHDGKPLVTMTPFAISPVPGQEGFLIHVSQLAAHTRDMMKSADVSLLIMEPEDGAGSVLATPRVAIACTAYRVERDSTEWENLARAYLDAIPDAGQRAAHIVSNMLEFSRRRESKMAPADLSELMEKALELAESDYDLKRKYDFRRIEIVRDYPETALIARCTKTEIEQVVLNIIKNAAQALSSKPLADQGPRITLRLSRDGQFARMALEDNGPGMDEATRKRVFEPFFTTKAPGLGTGLGLSVSYFIITQNHGGDMTVESSPGRGARFIIRLPLDTPESVSD